jgi:hypothetical protein
MSTQTIEPFTADAPTTSAPDTTTATSTTNQVSIGRSLYPDYPNPHHPPYGVVEVRKPPSSALNGYWRAELRDQFGVEPGSIISVRDPFVVAFHVWLQGDLWKCICGDWCFDMAFESIGGGPELKLSDIPGIAPSLMLRDWKGCAKGALHFWVVVTIPPGTIPAGKKNQLYRVGATFQMLDPCKNPSAVVGYQSLGEFQFYNPH